tara:strand:- start:282 stop:740 length:459 start_codon:yes stop_codon:yes gene_type:complete
MNVKNLKDVINWTRESHLYLASCMQHCVDQNENARAKLLLDYLADHEQKLVKVLDGFQETASTNALNTWCIEYLDKHLTERHGKCEKVFAQMNTEEIIAETLSQHEQVIDLYRYLHSRADIPEAIELLSQLLELEEHEAMRMSHSANRLQDM